MSRSSECARYVPPTPNYGDGVAKSTLQFKSCVRFVSVVGSYTLTTLGLSREAASVSRPTDGMYVVCSGRVGSLVFATILSIELHVVR